MDRRAGNVAAGRNESTKKRSCATHPLGRLAKNGPKSRSVATAGCSACAPPQPEFEIIEVPLYKKWPAQLPLSAAVSQLPHRLETAPRRHVRVALLLREGGLDGCPQLRVVVSILGRRGGGVGGGVDHSGLVHRVGCCRPTPVLLLLLRCGWGAEAEHVVMRAEGPTASQRHSPTRHAATQCHTARRPSISPSPVPTQPAQANPAHLQ